jgi:predicted dehydrogenase
MQSGCEVVGFLGTSAASVERTQSALRETLGFQGAGYTCLAEMLARCRPHLATVATPAPAHYEHVMACLGAGARVLCEKPLVSHEPAPVEEQLFLAARLVRSAEALGPPLAVNTQYVAAAPHLRALCGAEDPGTPVVDFFMQLESRGQNRTGGHEQIWRDLAAHPISVLLALVPGGRVDWSSVECVLTEDSNECRFRFVAPGGCVCETHFRLRNTPAGRLTRGFRLNGTAVGYEGRNDEDGVYCAYLTVGGRELKARDFMEESLTRFAAGDPLAPGEVGLHNLELQLRLIESATCQ